MRRQPAFKFSYRTKWVVSMKWHEGTLHLLRPHPSAMSESWITSNCRARLQLWESGPSSRTCCICWLARISPNNEPKFCIYIRTVQWKYPMHAGEESIREPMQRVGHCWRHRSFSNGPWIYHYQHLLVWCVLEYNVYVAYVRCIQHRLVNM